MEGYSRSLLFNNSPILNILNRKNVKLSNNTLAYAVKSPGDYEVKIFVTHDNINKVYIQKKDYDYTPGHVNQNTKFNLTPLQGKQDFPNFISEFHNDTFKKAKSDKNFSVKLEHPSRDYLISKKTDSNDEDVVLSLHIIKSQIKEFMKPHSQC